VESKELKMIKAAECALQIIANDGLEQLSFTRVSKACGISRGWLYKYIGQSPKALTDFAVDHFGKLFAEMDNRPSVSDLKSWSSAILEGTHQGFMDTDRYPWIVMIYFRYAHSNTQIGERIRKIDSQYQQVLTAEIERVFSVPRADAAVLAETLTSLRLGMSFRWLSPKTRAILGKRQMLDKYIRAWFEAISQR